MWLSTAFVSFARGWFMSLPAASLVVAVPAAIAGAACMGLASAAQSRATKQVPDTATLHPRLLWHLVREPIWLIGIGATVIGLSLQVVSLAFGPLLLVQPLLVCALPFASFFAALLAHHRVDRVIVLGAFICVAGLSAFLLLARPTGGGDLLLFRAPLAALAVPLGVIAIGGVLLSILVGGPVKVLGLSLATGVCYGVAAGLMKVVAGELRSGFAVPFGHWSLYAVCVIGPVGFLLSQNTFQQGRMVSPALAVITTIDPLVGVVIGVFWLGESAHTGTAAVIGEVIAALVIVLGIAVLSRRADQITVSRRPGRQPDHPPVAREADAAALGQATARSSKVQHLGPPPDLRSSETSTGTGR